MKPITLPPLHRQPLDRLLPDQAHRRVLRTDFYGHECAVYCTDTETPFPDGCLAVSRTDLNGIITHANEAFITLSGWSREELVGSAHNILRHPDMPAITFADMWETLQAGRKWHGYVKNLRKDGGYYWVYATVIPNIRHGQIQGYTSVRRKPARAKVAEHSEFYAQILRWERAQSQAA